MLNNDTQRINDLNNEEFLPHALEECRRLCENEGGEVTDIGQIFSLKNSCLKEEIKNGKNTEGILKTLITRRNHEERKCPHCGSTDLDRYGRYKDRQRYKCKKEMCGRTFTDLTNTIFASSKKSLDTWLKYIILMFSGATLRKISRELDINIQTAFKWRHRIIERIRLDSSNRQVGGLVQIGEVKFCERWGEFRDRRRPGIIYTAVEHTGRVIAQLAYEKEEKSIEFKNIFRNKLTEGTYIARPQNRNFRKFLEDIRKNIVRNIEVMSWNENINGLDCFRIAKVNLNIKFVIGKFRGIKMRYLQDYLDWFTWSNDSCVKYGAVNIEDALKVIMGSQC